MLPNPPPSPLHHALVNIGGDEVDASCYVGDPEIQAWNLARGYAANDTGPILGYYMARQAAALNAAGFKATFYAEAFGALQEANFSAWDGVLLDGWDPSTPSSLAPQLEAGAQCIVSSYCFLAPTQGCPDNRPGGLTPDQWSNRACEIQNKSLFPPSTAPFLKNMHGGHAARWGEQTDGTNLFQVRGCHAGCSAQPTGRLCRRPSSHNPPSTATPHPSSHGLPSWAPLRCCGAHLPPLATPPSRVHLPGARCAAPWCAAVYPSTPAVAAAIPATGSGSRPTHP